MSSPKASVIVLFMCSLYLLCCLPPIGWAASVNVKKLAAEHWVLLESEKFSVLSNADLAQTTTIINDLDYFSQFVITTLNLSPVRLKRKITLVLVTDDKLFRALGMPKNYVGIFIEREGGVVFARVDKFRSVDNGRSSGRLIVFHELVHVLMRLNQQSKPSPVWYNEGIAEYLGTYQQKNGAVIIGDIAALRDGFYSQSPRGGQRYKGVDSESLFKLTQQELTIGAKVSPSHTAFVDGIYARSAAVVHYLDATPERRKAMHRYLSLIHEGVSIDNAFEQAFGGTYRAFDQRVNHYVRKRKMGVRTFPLDVEAMAKKEKTITVVELSQWQTMVLLHAKISLFSDTFLGAGVREKMDANFERLFSELAADDL